MTMDINNQPPNVSIEVNQDFPIEFRWSLRTRMRARGLWSTMDHSRGKSTSGKCSCDRLCAKGGKCKGDNSYSPPIVVKNATTRLKVRMLLWLCYDWCHYECYHMKYFNSFPLAKMSSCWLQKWLSLSSSQGMFWHRKKCRLDG